MERSDECLWVDFVKGLLPVKEEGVEWLIMAFSTFYCMSLLIMWMGCEADLFLRKPNCVGLMCLSTAASRGTLGDSKKGNNRDQ